MVATWKNKIKIENKFGMVGAVGWLCTLF